MRVSIVIATFNAEKYLAQCLDSCINQTWAKKEIIVVDGGSKDSTVEIIRRYEKHIAYWHSKPDNGVYDAWNQALDHVTGDWVLFRGADDRFAGEHALSTAAQGLLHVPSEILIAYGTTLKYDRFGILQKVCGEPWESCRGTFLSAMVLPHPSLFHRRACFTGHGRFDTSYRIAGDYEFLLRVLDKGCAAYLPNCVVSHMHEGGLSSRGAVRSRIEAMRARRANRVGSFPFRLAASLIQCVVSSAAHGLARRLMGTSRYEAALVAKRRSRAKKLSSHVAPQHQVLSDA